MNKLSTRKQNNPVNNPIFFEKCRESAIQKGLYFRNVYELNPKICPECLTSLSYEKRKNKFCSSSCAATHTNKNRGEEEIKSRLEIIRKIHNCNGLNENELIQHRKNLRNSRKLNVEVCGPISFIYLLECKKCISRYYVGHASSKYCQACILNDRKIYRKSFKFYLNNKEHTFLFNSELIKKYGWYAPHNSSKPNLKGVTWDHLFRIEEGYLLNVDPKIMNHPANAELVPWQHNISRQKSMISYEDLLKRIELYNENKFNDLTYYYKD